MANREHNDGGVDLRGRKSPYSSSSEGSGTLQGDSSIEPRVADAGGITSPISSTAEDISMITNSRFFKPGAPFLVDSSPPDARFSSEQSSPPAPREPMRLTRSRNGPGTNPFSGGGYRSSRTWVAPEAQHNQEFLIIRNSMRRLFKHSDVAKWKLQDYTAHREAMLASKKEALAKSLKQKELERELRMPQTDAKVGGSLEKLIPGGKNLRMQGNYSRVLGLKTIWCHDWMNGKDDEIAPWPSFAEMKWEGDDRAKTNCGRYLPLPREPGAPGIQWGQLQVVEQYPLDRVQCIPTMEDIYLPVDEIEDDDIPKLLNKDLLDAIDAYLES